jgi:PAS domain S-box-containing protein
MEDRTGQAASPDSQLFYDAFKASSIGIALENLDGQPLFVNSALCSMLGLSEQEMLGKHCVEFSPPEDAAKDWALFEQLRAGSIDHYQIEKRFLRRDGSLIWGRLSISLLKGATPMVVAIVEDVTEKRKAEETLRESEQRFRLVADTAPVLMWMSGTDKLCTYFNRLWLDFTGRSIEEEFGNGWAEGVHPEDLQRCLDTYTQSFDRRENFRTEYRLRRHDGEYRWVLDIGVPRFNQDRSFAGYIGIGVDVTDRKRADQALHESEERLRLAIQAGRMYAYEWDLTTGVIVRSPEYVNVLGATEPRTLTHQQVMEKIHPEDRAKLVEAVASHSPQKPTVDVTYRVLLPGKPPVWVKSSGRAFFDEEGRMLRVVGIVADITDLKLAEESLRASEERLRLAQKVAGIGTFERDIRTGALTWTAEMESMYGLPPGGFGRTRRSFEDLVHPADRPEVIKLVDSALKTGQPTSGEWRVIWPDGSVHWIAGRWQLLMDESGKPSRVVGVDMDITERKRAEQVLANMTRKLVEAQEQERARIARELHDDINQRLAMLVIELEQLRDNRPELPSEVQTRIHQVRRQMTDISADVQALSHDLHSSQLEYLGVVAGMKSWCKEFGERQGMQIDCTHDVQSVLPAEIGLCLFRVLQEALHNAAKHSGVKRIEVQLREESNEIHLIVRDSGRGFDVEAAQGKGLGLTSMRERVRLVHGTIAIESKRMGGTTIHVRVPLESARASQRKAV